MGSSTSMRKKVFDDLEDSTNLNENQTCFDTNMKLFTYCFTLNSIPT